MSRRRPRSPTIAEEPGEDDVEAETEAPDGESVAEADAGPTPRPTRPAKRED
jgi:hypothetical protein